MTKYLDKVWILTIALKYFGIFHIPRHENIQADALSRLATLEENFFRQTYIEYLETPSIEKIEEV